MTFFSIKDKLTIEHLFSQDYNDDISLEDYMRHSYESSKNEFEILTPDCLAEVRDKLATQSDEIGARKMIK